MSGGKCPGVSVRGQVSGVSVQGVSVRGISSRGAYVLGVRVWGVHVQRCNLFLPPIKSNLVLGSCISKMMAPCAMVSVQHKLRNLQSSGL